MNLKIIFFSMLFALAYNANATTTTAPVKSTASIASSCQISATNISFGTYNPNSGNSFSTGNISLLCTKGTTATVGINLNASATDVAAINTTFSAYYAANNQYYSRIMTGPNSNVLYYNLFQDSNHTQVFGGSNYFHLNSNAFVTITSTGTSQNIPVYGAMGGGQYVTPGN